MRCTTLTLAVAFVAAPLSLAIAAPQRTPQKTDRSFEQTALADLRHAEADLALLRVTTPDPSQPRKPPVVSWHEPSAGRVAAARSWAERAESALLNTRSYDANGALTGGAPITGVVITDIERLRSDITKHELGKARQDVRAAIRELQSEMPRA
jgi:hypothetical protein